MGAMQPQDRIIFAMDVDSADRARRLADTLSGHVGMFKVGLELFVSCALSGVDLVSEIGQRGKVFLDLKVHDIPATMRGAMAAAATSPAVRFVTVHTSEGPEPLRTAVQRAGDVEALGVTVLTSVAPDSMGQLGYKVELGELVLLRARWAVQGGCAGVVCSGHEAARVREVVGRERVIVTPGIRMPGTGAQDQARVMTPSAAVGAGADYIVVGRPIRDADDPAAAADLIAEDLAQP